MWRFYLVVALLIFPLSIPHSPIVQARPAAQNNSFAIFLPLVTLPLASVRVVVTERREIESYPSYYIVSGYLQNLTNTTFYSVTLEADTTTYWYSPPGVPPMPPSVGRVEFNPIFEAVLPGEQNPFEYSLVFGKSYAKIGDVHIVSATDQPPNGAVAHSLTILDWRIEGGALSGTVRNDSGHALRDLRIVVGWQSCFWRNISVDTLTLMPGQKAAFQLDTYWAYCQDETPVIIGQGIEQQ